MIKILHTADLHLDSPLSGLDRSAADAARDEQRNVFKKMMTYVRENEIDLVLIPGDLFDTKYISPATRNIVKEELDKLSCPVVIAPGNHDPYTKTPLYKDGALGENVHIFSSEQMQIFDFDSIGVSVCGYAFMSDRLDVSPLCDFSMTAEAHRAKSDNVLVLCAHADLTAPISKYAPVTVSDIERCKFVYAALGHVHNPPEISSTTTVKYSGFPSGRGFDELGDGGAYLVCIDGDSVTAEKIIFSSHRFMEDTVDVSDSESEADIESIIRRHIDEKGYANETSLCLTLAGTIPFDLVINEKKLSALSTPLRSLKIKNDTTPIEDAEKLSMDPTLRGEVYRKLLPMLTSADVKERKRATDALRIALCAIDSSNVSQLLAIDSIDSADEALK